MPVPQYAQTGEQIVGGVGVVPFRAGQLADLIVSELQGKYYEQNYRGRLFSGGKTLTAINNATFTSATLDGTATPITGVWNPMGSPVNLVILAAMLGLTVTAATSTGGGPFVWSASVGNKLGTPTTGQQPFNRKSLSRSLAPGSGGSYAVDMSMVALTGLTNNLVVLGASALNGGSGSGFSFVGTAVGDVAKASGVNIELLEGAIIVPPGGILALQATTTPVAHSAASGLIWAEMPL